MTNRSKAMIALLALATGTAAAHAGEPDAAVIAEITRLETEVKDGVVRVAVPRSDLSVVADGVRMTPFQGLTSWAAFERAGAKSTIVMGDLTLTEREVNPAMSAALENGLEVTALHNHFFYETPRIFFMHIGGTGSTAALAKGVRKALDAAAAAAGSPADGFGGPKIAETSTLDAKRLESILESTAQTKDGMLKFVFGEQTSMHGAHAGAAMGVNTWAAFAGSAEAAVVDGDFAVREEDLQAVLKALRRSNVNIVAIHNHMTHEQPRIVFLHFWAKGPADVLARAVKAGRDARAERARDPE